MKADLLTSASHHALMGKPMAPKAPRFTVRPRSAHDVERMRPDAPADAELVRLIYRAGNSWIIPDAPEERRFAVITLRKPASVGMSEMNIVKMGACI